MRTLVAKLPPHFTCTKCGRHRLAANIGAGPSGVVCADGCAPRDCRCRDPHCSATPCEVCHTGEPSQLQRITLQLQQGMHMPRPDVVMVDHIAPIRRPLS